MCALLLDVGLWNDLSGQVEPFAEVVETLRSQRVVVPLPGELCLCVAAAGEGLKGLHTVPEKKNISVCRHTRNVKLEHAYT